MTSVSCSSRGLLGDSLRLNLWGFVLGGVGFFFSLLLPVLMTMQHALEMRAEQLQHFPDLVDQDWQAALTSVFTGGRQSLCENDVHCDGDCVRHCDVCVFARSS